MYRRTPVSRAVIMGAWLANTPNWPLALGRITCHRPAFPSNFSPKPQTEDCPNMPQQQHSLGLNTERWHIVQENARPLDWFFTKRWPLGVRSRSVCPKDRLPVWSLFASRPRSTLLNRLNLPLLTSRKRGLIVAHGWFSTGDKAGKHRPRPCFYDVGW